jgi:hypothetical protein
VLVDRVVRAGPAVQDVRPVAAGRLATVSESRGLVTANLRMESANHGLAMLNLATGLHALRAMASASRGAVMVSLRMASASPGLPMLNLATGLPAPLVMVSASRGLAMLNLGTVRHVPLVMASVNRGRATVSLRMANVSRGPAMLNLATARHVPLAMASANHGAAMLNPVIVPRVPAAIAPNVMASASPGPRTAAGQVLRETRVRGAQEATDPSAITTRIRSRRGSSSAAKSALSNQNLNHNSREQTLIVRLSAISPR